MYFIGVLIRFIRSGETDLASPEGASDFPTSLCFMWFWFGLEILRLVYKKEFINILNGFYLIWAFNLKKQHPPLSELRKNFFKIGRKGYQKKRNFALISKMCRTLASRSSQKIFFRKTIFCKLSKSLKIQFFCTNFFPFAKHETSAHFLNQRKIPLFWYPDTQFRRNFISTLIRGGATFFRG